MNQNKPLIVQKVTYDEAFWENESNAKLVPLKKQQIRDLEEEKPLSVQFRTNKNRLKRS